MAATVYHAIAGHAHLEHALPPTFVLHGVGHLTVTELAALFPS